MATASPVIVRRRAQLLLVVGLVLLLPGVAALLHAYPPADYHFYPPCLLHMFTGLHCPGCGATRCVHALVHLDLPQALAYNALLVALLPYFAAVGIRHVWSLWTGRRLPPLVSVRVGWMILAVILGFALLRNVDVYPLTVLAPHRLQ